MGFKGIPMPIKKYTTN